MSPFAAGCAICGADLEAHRAGLAARRSPRDLVPLPAIRLPQVDDDVLVVAFVAVLGLVAPLFALLLALLAMRDPRRANVRAYLAILAAICLAALFVPALRYGAAWYLWG